MLKLEIVTPEKRVIDADVDSVTVPTATGEVGILPSHAPLIAGLKPGILSYAVKGSTEKLAVSGGFVEVNTDRVSVLVDTAERADEIDVDAAKASRDAAEKALSSSGSISADDSNDKRETLDHAVARISLASSK
ncbi:F0F1 ATP synthase subunit epsilon [soil metagenome]